MKLQMKIIVPLLLISGLAVADEAKPPTIELLRLASEKGEAEGQFLLGRAYLHGEGVAKDPKKAFELIQSAANQGYPDAVGGMGYFYSAGIVVPKNDNLAMDWFRKGAEKGSAKAQLNLGKTLLKTSTPGKIWEEGVKWTKQAADQGLVEAELSYGSILYFGDKGIPKNLSQAAVYLRRAAEAGNAEAQNMVGQIEELDLGVLANRALAEEWYRKAALQGLPKAQSNLARVLWSSPKVSEESRIEALAWFMVASGQGDVTARKYMEDYTPILEKAEMEAARKKAAELINSLPKKKPSA